MGENKNPALGQEQTGQVYPDKDVAPKGGQPATGPTPAAPKEFALPKAQVRPRKKN